MLCGILFFFSQNYEVKTTDNRKLYITDERKIDLVTFVFRILLQSVTIALVVVVTYQQLPPIPSTSSVTSVSSSTKIKISNSEVGASQEGTNLFYLPSKSGNVDSALLKGLLYNGPNQSIREIMGSNLTSYQKYMLEIGNFSAKELECYISPPLSSGMNLDKVSHMHIKFEMSNISLHIVNIKYAFINVL